MIIAKNYFTITDKLYKNLFEDDLYKFKQNKLVFIKGFESGGENTFLNYYNFNILLNNTKNQNTIFHVLNDNFFNDLSLHKNKIIFSGLVNEDRTIFTLTKMVYLHPYKKLGILVRKNIMLKFNERDVNVRFDKKQLDDNVAVFIIQ